MIDILKYNVKFYIAENPRLQDIIYSLHEQALSIQVLLRAHENCPIARATGYPQQITDNTNQ